MSILNSVVKGRLKEPYLVLIYGVEGIGKSTFASNAPRPIFLGSEKGTGFLDVERLYPSDFASLLECLDALLTDSHTYQTVVIDSIDWLEPMIHKKVLAEKGKGKTSIEDIGYAKGYIFALDYWRMVIGKLSELRSKKNMNVILIGHSVIKTFHDPNLIEGYERYQLKLHEKAGGLLKEFCDFVLFANYETQLIVDDNKKNRARGEGKRVLHTQHRPSFDAKSRLAIPFEIPLSWKTFQMHCDKMVNEGSSDMVKKLVSMAEGLVDKTIKNKVLENVKKAKDNLKELKSIEIQLLNIL